MIISTPTDIPEPKSDVILNSKIERVFCNLDKRRCFASIKMFHFQVTCGILVSQVSPKCPRGILSKEDISRYQIRYQDIKRRYHRSAALAGAPTLQLSLRHRGVLQDHLSHIILLRLSTLHARQSCCHSSKQLLHIVACLR